MKKTMTKLRFLFLFVLITGFLLVGAVGTASEGEYGLAGTAPTLKVEAVNNAGGVFTPDGNGNIYIRFVLNQKYTENITVKFVAQDYTAVAEAKDYAYYIYGTCTRTSNPATIREYTHVEQQVTIYAGETVQQICYQTNTSYIANTFNSTTYDKTFTFIVTSVKDDKGNNITSADGTSYENQKYTCRLKNSKTVPLAYASSNYYLSYYDLEYKAEFDKILEWGDWKKTISKNYIYDKTNYSVSEVIANTIKREELGADLYACGETSYWADWWNVGKLEIGVSFGKDSSTRLSMSEKSFIGDHSTGLSTSGTAVSYGGKAYVKIAYDDSSEVYKSSKNNANDAIKRSEKTTITTRLLDTKKANAVGYYLDTSGVAVDGKIRLSVVFDEAVQVTTTAKENYPSVVGYFGVNDKCTFKYLGGSLTTTLVFEADINSNDLEAQQTSVYKSFKIDKFRNVKYVGDCGKGLSGGCNKYTADDFDYTKTGYPTASCYLDLRIPSVSTETVNPGYSQPDRTVTVNITKMSEGTLYYLWSTSVVNSSDPNDYQGSFYFQRSTDDNTSRTVDITSTPGINGEYFLNVFVVSKYGKERHYTCGREGTEIAKGGFKFDNKSPEIVSITKETDTLVNKILSLEVNENILKFNSGLKEIYMSVSEKESGFAAKEYCIWREGSVNEFSYPNTVYMLNSGLKFCYSTYVNQDYHSYTQTYGYASGMDGPERATFSSKEKAKEYLRYKELGDITLVCLTQQNALDLKANEGKYTIADGETHQNPQAGEYWIRYKKSNWNYDNDQTNENKWTFYYYGENSLDTNNFSTLLNTAIDNVVNSLVGKGENVNLIEAGFVNEYGLPTLKDMQVHEKETLTKTYGGSTYDVAVSYKDDGIVIGTSGGKGTLLINAGSEYIGLTSSASKTVYIGFYAVDNANNSSYIDIVYTPYSFDTRILFDYDAEATQGGTKAVDIEPEEDIEAYDLTMGNVTMQFTYVPPAEETPEQKALQKSLFFLNVSYGEQNFDKIALQSVANYSEYFSLGLSQTNGDGYPVIQIELKKPGFVSIELGLKIGADEKFSLAKTLYLTLNKEEETANYKTTKENLVLVNHVYQLGTDYYYMDADSRICNETYGGAVAPASFSSLGSLEEYLRYMEYKDFYIVELSSYMAQMLQSNGGGESQFTKANEEKQTAEEGDLWIRYKASTWTTSCTTSDWRYYCYIKHDMIGVGTPKYSAVLSSAVDSVVRYLRKKVEEVDLVGAGHIDENKAPYLDPSQCHFEKEDGNYTMTGKKLDIANMFSGDKGLYSNDITVSNYSDIPLATNMKIKAGTETRLFYAYDKAGDGSDLEYKVLNVADGQTIKSALQGSAEGVYYIREYNKTGVREFPVYLDLSVPTIHISFTSAVEGERNTLELNRYNDGATYNCKDFYLGDMTKEYDSMAYIAVYTKKASAITLKTTYFASDLKEAMFSLDTANYYIEVGDRSGNVFTFIVQICSEELKVTVTTAQNKYVSVSCNRDADEIKTFQVKLNGTLLETPYTGDTLKYKESGYYMILVEDIYGYVFELKGESGVGMEFSRELPTVNWSYEESKDNYVAYKEGKSPYMKMYSSLDMVYYISTARRLRFSFTEEYEFEFVDLSASEWSYNPVSHIVSINSDTGFVLNVWYSAFPNVRVQYVCSTDYIAPSIEAMYKVTCYSLQETDMLCAGRTTSDAGTEYIPENLSYYVDTESSAYISEREYVNTNLIKVNVTDQTGVTSVEVYLDGGLLEKHSSDTGKIGTISLSRYGEYKIVAYDVFNNKAEMVFFNASVDKAEYAVDNEVKENYVRDDTLVYYGNESATLKISGDGEVFFLATIEGKQYFVYYTVTAGQVVPTKYICQEYIDTDSEDPNIMYSTKSFKATKTTTQGTDSKGNAVNIDVVVFNVKDILYREEKWYQLNYKYGSDGNILDGMNIFVKYDADKNITFRVDCADERMMLETRAYFGGNKEPYYYKAMISPEKTDVEVVNKKKVNLQVATDKVTRTNTEFKVVASSISKYITEITMSYSNVREYTDFVRVYSYENEGVVEDFDTTQNGFYLIRIVNVFGNTNEYTVYFSDVFTVLSVAIYDDGKESRFDNDYSGTIKTNTAFKVEAYADSATFDVLYNDQPISVTPLNESGFLSLRFSAEGCYKITVTDNFGNVVVRDFEIKITDISYEERFLYGYNEKALLKSEGYTNQKLSVLDTIVSDGKIAYISVEKDGKEVVLYNGLMQQKVEFDASLLMDAVGADGDGTYTVTFRDEYGSATKKVIHYSSTPTLAVYRQTRSSVEQIPCNLADLKEDGVWANQSVTITTSSVQYKLTDGDNNNLICPKSFEFGTATESGTKEFNVHYIDEYGFEYTFTVHLVRQTLVLSFPDSLGLKEINEKLTTRSNIKANFAQGLRCSYVLDNGEPIYYEGGTYLYRDGLYRFTLTDRAGNVTTKVIVKDTVCEFNFVESDRNKVLLNGDVSNTAKVLFKAVNGDSVYIKKIYNNGEEIENKGQTAFAGTGKWSMIIGDGIGNQTFFEFYIITHAISSFEYTTPNNYIITEFMYDSGDGVNSSYLSYIEQTENNSSFAVSENGHYSVVMTSKLFNNVVSFSFDIDSTPPVATLDGCLDGETTINTITLSGCQVGDTVYVYRNGELAEKVYVSTTATEIPSITEGGTYRIVVENQAGVQVEMNFVRKHIANPAGSALIIILCLLVSAGIVIGMVLRNRQKVDE